MRPTTATIKRECPRYQDWLEVFGTDTIQITMPLPCQGSVPGVAAAEFYKLYVPSLTAEQRARLMAFLAGKFGEPPSIVEALIDDPEHGVPIKADDVSVAVDARAFL